MVGTGIPVNLLHPYPTLGTRGFLLRRPTDVRKAEDTCEDLTETGNCASKIAGTQDITQLAALRLEAKIVKSAMTKSGKCQGTLSSKYGMTVSSCPFKESEIYLRL